MRDTEAYKSKLNRKLIARICSCLQSHNRRSTLYVKAKWETEAKMTVSEEDWLNICKNPIEHFKFRLLEGIYMHKYDKIFHHSNNKTI